MNQKSSRMLRDMRSATRTHKRLWNALTHIEKGQVRQKWKDSVKLVTPSLDTCLERT